MGDLWSDGGAFVNSAYLGAITFLEWARGLTYQNYFYQVISWRIWRWGCCCWCLSSSLLRAFAHTHARPNRRAVRVGTRCSSFVGVAHIRDCVDAHRRLHDPGSTHPLDGLLGARDHPLLVVWLYVLHRLEGPRIKWALLAAGSRHGGIVAVMVILNMQDPRAWNQKGPAEGTVYFEPSLARTGRANSFLRTAAVQRILPAMSSGHLRELVP